jgi:hypothetical protein
MSEWLLDNLFDNEIVLVNSVCEEKSVSKQIMMLTLLYDTIKRKICFEVAQGGSNIIWHTTL